MQKVKTLLISIIFVICSAADIWAQHVEDTIKQLNHELARYRIISDSLENLLEDANLRMIAANLNMYGLPEIKQGEELIEHNGYILVFSQKHHQAAWVAHMIISEVAESRVSRTNDFRPDPLVKGGSAVESDYFLRIVDTDSTITYDGFGFDRGHLVPSADLRWSQKALSETYLYSNISPQLPDFNREKWAELENILRAYVIEGKSSSVFVVTGPVFSDSATFITKGVNKLPVPSYFFKAVFDKPNMRSIAFLMPHTKLEYPVEWYAITIDSLESFTGIDFFASLDDSLESSIESQCDYKYWLTVEQKNDVKPLKETERPKNTYNTVEAALFSGTNKNVCICGTVVSTHISAKGNVFINLDKSFPNQIFSISIFKKNLVNFSYLPHIYLQNKKICVKGLVKEYEGTPGIYPVNEKAIYEIE